MWEPTAEIQAAAAAPSRAIGCGGDRRGVSAAQRRDERAQAQRDGAGPGWGGCGSGGRGKRETEAGARPPGGEASGDERRRGRRRQRSYSGGEGPAPRVSSARAGREQLRAANGGSRFPSRFPSCSGLGSEPAPGWARSEPGGPAPGTGGAAGAVLPKMEAAPPRPGRPAGSSPLRPRSGGSRPPFLALPEGLLRARGAGGAGSPAGGCGGNQAVVAQEARRFVRAWPSSGSAALGTFFCSSLQKEGRGALRVGGEASL